MLVESPPTLDARYCKSLNSSIASRTLRHPKNNNKNAEVILDHRTRSGFIQSPNLRSLMRQIVHVYRTGLLAAIMNLISNNRFCTQRKANASTEQLTRGGGGGGVGGVINYDRD